MYGKETKLNTAIRKFIADEDGMTSVEYALGALAATALAGALYAVAQSQTVRDAIEAIITNALST